MTKTKETYGVMCGGQWSAAAGLCGGRGGGGRVPVRAAQLAWAKEKGRRESVDDRKSSEHAAATAHPVP